jgi:hypothetical protein
MILLVMEVGLEFRAHRRGFDSLLFGPATVRFAADPSEDAEPSSEVGPTESFPFRSPVVPPSKPEGTVRIWFGSASHGEDTAVPVRQVFPNLMGNLLEETGRRVEVLNASRAGLVFSDNAGELREGGSDWQPDYAVLYGASMDLGNLSKMFLGAGGRPVLNTRGGGSGNREAEGDGGSPDLVSGPFRRLDRFYEETTVYAHLKSRITTLITLERLLADSLPTVAGELFGEAVGGFVDAAEAVGAVPVLTTFATSHGWLGPQPLPRGVEMFLVRYNPYLKPTGWQKAVHTLNDVVRQVARERNVVLLELQPDLTNRTQLFRDPVHFTPAGHAEAAALLANRFAEAFGWIEAGGGS